MKEQLRYVVWARVRSEDLDVMEPKTPEQIYKTHLEDKSSDAKRERYIYTYMYIYIRIYLHTYRERESEQELEPQG